MLQYLRNVSRTVEEWIELNFSSQDVHANKLYESMKYSLLAGGKRLRPTLVMMGYDLFDPHPVDISHPALSYATAAEMIHTYSLIHDDLPGMDDDDTRRGNPTNHIIYGVAAAILAGDGLLTKAFEVMLTGNLPVERKAQAALIMAKAAGPDGMVAGQYADMSSQGEGNFPENAMLDKSVRNDSASLVGYIHTNKTAALISACIQAGAVLAGANEADMRKLKLFGDKTGVAFQIADDILDLTATSEELGKPAGSDEKLDKLTYPKVYGLEESREHLNNLIEESKAIISAYGDKARYLSELAIYIGERRT